MAQYIGWASLVAQYIRCRGTKKKEKKGGKEGGREKKEGKEEGR